MVLFFIILVQGVIFAIACNYLAKQKGKDSTTWTIIGLFLGVIGLLLIGFSADESEKANKKEIIPQRVISNDEFKKSLTQNPTINVKSPIDIIGYNVIVENETVYLKADFKNISDKSLNAVNFTIECLNSFGKPVADTDKSEIDMLIQDIELKPTESLEGLVYKLQSHPSTRKVNIVIKEALFCDESSWEHSPDDIIKEEVELIANQDILKVIRGIEGLDIIAYAEGHDDRWQCVCGRSNSIGQLMCLRCSREKEVVLDNYNKSSLDLLIEKYKEIRADKIKELGSELYEEYSIINNTSNIKGEYVPFTIDNKYWVCSCGKLNKAEDENCLLCRRSRETQFEYLNKVFLIKSLSARKSEELNIKRKKIIKLAITLVIAILGVGVYITGPIIIKEVNYKKAEKLLIDGNYQQAITAFNEMNTYKNSEERVNETTYLYAEKLLEDGEYTEAINEFSRLNTYKDSKERVNETTYLYAEKLLETGEHAKAIRNFSDLITYKDSEERVNEAKYMYAESLRNDGKDEEAIWILSELKNNRDWESRINETVYSHIEKLLENAEYEQAVIWYKVLGYYKDNEYKEDLYRAAVGLFDKKYFNEARFMFSEFRNYKNSKTYLTSNYYLIEGTWSEKNAYIDIEYKLLDKGYISYSFGSSNFEKLWLDGDYKFGYNKSTYEYIVSVSPSIGGKLVLRGATGKTTTYYRLK